MSQVGRYHFGHLPAEQLITLFCKVEAILANEAIAPKLIDEGMKVVHDNPVAQKDGCGDGVVEFHIARLATGIMSLTEARIVAFLDDWRDCRPYDPCCGGRTDLSQNKVEVTGEDLHRDGILGTSSFQAPTIPKTEIEVNDVGGGIDIPWLEVEEVVQRVHAVLFGRPDLRTLGQQLADDFLITEADRITDERDAFFHRLIPPSM